MVSRNNTSKRHINRIVGTRIELCDQLSRLLSDNRDRIWTMMHMIQSLNRRMAQIIGWHYGLHPQRDRQVHLIRKSRSASHAEHLAIGVGQTCFLARGHPACWRISWRRRNALTTHLYIVSEVSIVLFIGAVRGPKSAVHTVSQITTPEDHVHVLSVDGARVLMVAEAITEAFPEDRSFFRIANQLGKQQGYEPEKLQNTARVHWMWRWWRFRKAFARRLRRVRRKSGHSMRRFLGQGMCAYTHLRDFVLDQVGWWSSTCSNRIPSTSFSATMSSSKPMHRLLWCLCLCLHLQDVVSTKDVFSSLSMASGMQPSSFPWQRKRAYNRACRRAMVHGTTIYRGKPFQLPAGATLIRSEGMPRSSMRRHHDRSPGCRLRMLTWNCGGANAIYDQFLLWLFQSSIEMAVLVETKWSFSQCWSDQHYHYIHSGAGSKKGSGGVLVILSRQLTHSQAIRYHEAIPGHLLREFRDL